MTLNNYAIQTIMLAEDDEDDKIIFQDVLREINPKIKVEYVSNGVKLLELIKNFAPDILFLDLDMPFKNGLECLVEIRSNPLLESLPVIVFSSTTRQSNIQTAYEMGAHLFLIKSSAISEYVNALKTILSMDWTDPNIIKEQYCINNRYAAFS